MCVWIHTHRHTRRVVCMPNFLRKILKNQQVWLGWAWLGWGDLPSSAVTFVLFEG